MHLVFKSYTTQSEIEDTLNLSLSKIIDTLKATADGLSGASGVISIYIGNNGEMNYVNTYFNTSENTCEQNH